MSPGRSLSSGRPKAGPVCRRSGGNIRQKPSTTASAGSRCRPRVDRCHSRKSLRRRRHIAVDVAAGGRLEALELLLQICEMLPGEPRDVLISGEACAVALGAMVGPDQLAAGGGLLRVDGPFGRGRLLRGVIGREVAQIVVGKPCGDRSHRLGSTVAGAKLVEGENDVARLLTGERGDRGGRRMALGPVAAGTDCFSLLLPGRGVIGAGRLRPHG